MTKQQEALRLILTTTLSNREIGTIARVSKTTVARYRHMVAEKQLTWETLQARPLSELDALFNQPRKGNRSKPVLNYALLADELAAKKMSIQVWWEDYARDHGQDRQAYSTVTEGLRAYRKKMPSFMHMQHVPGQKAYVDFSGPRPHYDDPKTGERVTVELFVGLLGASNLTFAMAVPSQRIPDFLQAHARMFAYFGGVPAVVVPDNLKSARDRSKHDELQRGYSDLTRHYGVSAQLARPYHPKDKSKVERQVGILGDRMLARMRGQTFHSLEELNRRIAELLEDENNRPMAKGLPSRRERFLTIEQAALRPLPPTPYEYADIKPAITVDGGYHVLVLKHRYSVPNMLTGQRVDARVTSDRVEFFHDGKRIAAHVRSYEEGGLTTDPLHQTDAHRAQSERTPDGLRAWAQTAGPTIHRFLEKLFNTSRPFEGLRPADKVKTLAGKYGTAFVERALASYPQLDFVTVSDLQRKLSIQQAREGTSPTVKRSRNACGARSYP